MPSLLAGSAGASKTTGPVKALQAFRKRKEKQKLHTAKELRQYKKVMQKSGYEPGTGAKRRRRDETPMEEEEDVAAAVTDPTTRTTQQPVTNTMEQRDNNKNMKKPKTSPTTAASKASKEAMTAERIRKEQKRHEQERHRKLAVRKKRTELLQQKTSRGQPVMKNLVHDILHKLQNESSTE